VFRLSRAPAAVCVFMERLLMEFRIWVEVHLAGRVLHRQLVAQVEREATGIGPEQIGLTLEEGKTVLSQVQAGMIHRQVEALQAAHRNCRQCGRKQRIKDRRRRCLRTIFGVVRVSCRRFLRCRCQGGRRVTVCGRSMAGRCRGPRRSGNTFRRIGAANCRIVEVRESCKSCSQGGCRTLR
jgi:hypothetical protein